MVQKFEIQALYADCPLKVHKGVSIILIIMQNKSEPVWEWYPSRFVLRQQVNGKQLFWNTSPSLVLYDPLTPNITTQLNVDVSIVKSFNYDSKTGWNWHKSWILPEIIVNVGLAQEKVKSVKFPQQAYIQIYSVIASDDPNNFLLTDIPLEGITKIKAEIGKNKFNTLKFTSTSFKEEKAKFNLLVVIAMTDQKWPKIPHVMWSFISPPIFIDSRRSARKDCQMVSQNTIFSQFNPKYFSSELFSKRSKQSRSITHDLQGLLNYFKAANIRNKIKNPFFLCYRFSQCIQLYYNPNKIIDEQDIVNICMKEFRAELHKIAMKTDYEKGKIQFDKINPNALLSMRIIFQDFLQKGLLKDIFYKLINDNSLINIVFEPSLLKDRFIKIIDIENIRIQYENQYSRSKSTIFLKMRQPDKVQVKTQFESNHTTLLNNYNSLWFS